MDAWRRRRPLGGCPGGAVGPRSPCALWAEGPQSPLGSPRGSGVPGPVAQRAHEKTGPWAAARELGREMSARPVCPPRGRASWAWRRAAARSCRDAGSSGAPGPRAGQPCPRESSRGPRRSALSSGAPGARACRALSLLRRGGGDRTPGQRHGGGTWAAPTPLPLRSSLERGSLLIAGS